MNMTNLVKGLRTVRIANIIEIAGIFFMMVASLAIAISSFSMVANAGTTGSASTDIMLGTNGWIIFIGIIFVFVSGIMQMIGLSKVSDIHDGYKKASMSVLAGIIIYIVVSGLAITMLTPAIINQALNLLPVVARCLAVYFIISATVTFLESKGNKDLAARGVKVRNVYIVCTAIVVIATLAALVPVLMMVANSISTVASLVQLIALFKYVGFLGKSATALES